MFRLCQVIPKQKYLLRLPSLREQGDWREIIEHFVLVLSRWSKSLPKLMDHLAERSLFSETKKVEKQFQCRDVKIPALIRFRSQHCCSKEYVAVVKREPLLPFRDCEPAVRQQSFHR